MTELITVFIYGIIVGGILQYHFNCFDRLEDWIKNKLHKIKYPIM